MSFDQITAYTAQEFSNAFGRAPQWIAAAPGRVNIIGEHTDYNDGFVMPMGIERYTVVAAGPAKTEGTITLRSTLNREPVVLKLDQPLKPLGKGMWVNYPAGVIAGFVARGNKLPGVDVMVHSNVPLGGGLSSSAALEVATATLLEAVTGRAMDPVEKALLCQKAEHDFAGMPCGIMDQFISAMAKKDHLLLIDCRSHETEAVPMTDPSVQVLIINTNVKHELTGSEYPTRRKQCEEAARALKVPALRDATMDMLAGAGSRMDATVFRRARHVIGEDERTVTMARAVARGDWANAGRLMYESHASLRDDYEVSCKELDVVVEIAQGIGMKDGVIGCRMTGGGFGGCAVALVRAEAVDAVSRQMAQEYERRTGIKPDLFTSRPGAGAMVVKG